MTWPLLPALTLTLFVTLSSTARDGFEPQGGRLSDLLLNDEPQPTNICDTIMSSLKLQCHCDISDVAEAEELECWVIEPMAENDSVWDIFDTQENAQELMIHVNPEGILGFIPAIALSVLNELKKLIMLNTNITTVSFDAFAQHQQLTTIVLNNSITKLEEKAFYMLPELLEIDLSNNKIREINKNVFVNMSNFERLDVSQNLIVTVHDFAFEGVPTMSDLDLSRNNLTVLTPEVFSGLAVLTKLDLYRNQLTHLGPRTFEKLVGLTYLDISHNFLSSIHETAFDGLHNLQILRLKENKLATLQDGVFSSLLRMNFLDVSQNALERLPATLFTEVEDGFKGGSSVIRFDENPVRCDCDFSWLHALRSSAQNPELLKILDRSLCRLGNNVRRVDSLSLSEFCEATATTTEAATTTVDKTTRRPPRRRTTTPRPLVEVPTVVFREDENSGPNGIYKPETEQELHIEPQVLPETRQESEPEPVPLPKSSLQPVYELSTEGTTERSTERTTERSTERTTERSTERITERPTSGAMTPRPPLPTVRPRLAATKVNSAASVPLQSVLVVPCMFLAWSLL